MKALILVVPCFFLSIGNAYAGGAVKLGIDFPGSRVEATDDRDNTFDVEGGTSLAFEGFGVFRNVDFGGGIEFQGSRKLSETNSRAAIFTPIYLMLRLRPKMRETTPYFTLQLGLAIFDPDDRSTVGFTAKNGVHFALGGGVLLQNFLIELRASLDTGSLDPIGAGDYTYVGYSKVTLGFGFNF